VGTELLAQIADAAQEAATHADATDPLASHRAATRAVCRVAADHARLLHALYRWHAPGSGAALRETFLERTRTALERGMDAGRLRRENSALAAHALLGLYA